MQIQNPLTIPLPAEAGLVLRKLFPDYQRVVILAKMGGGFGGGRIFKVQPIDAHGVEELPTIVKMAPVQLIKQEWSAYTNHIQNKVARVAQIQGEAVFADTWGGLRYDLIGEGVFDVVSLIEFCRHADMKNILHLLEKQLFAVMGEWWRKNDFEPAFHLSSSYDPILPVNLMIQPTSVQGTTGRVIRPFPNQPSQQGDTVHVDGFTITEIDVEHKTVTLNRPPSTGELPGSYRIRLQPVDHVETLQIGEEMDPVAGVVSQTRHDLMLAEAAAALGPNIDLSAEEMMLSNGTTLPNPLQRLTAVLAAMPGVNVSSIHGDFNVENILVERRSQTVHLIDFADARRDHVLKDLLRLETGIVTQLLPECLEEADDPAVQIHHFYTQLHCTMLDTNSGSLFRAENGLHREFKALAKPFAIVKAIRQIARDLLVDKTDWTEYYHGLTLYLLGSLKFKNLTRQARQIAFWGAAGTQKLVTDPPLCKQPRLFRTCRGRVAITILLFAILIALGIFFLTSRERTGAEGEPIAAIMNFHPQVAVQRRATDRLQDAAFAMTLSHGDIVLTYEEAAAIVACKNGLLFQMPPENNLKITCEDSGDKRLIERLDPALINVSDTISFNLVNDETRSTRGEEEETPRLLTPRNSLITETVPTFTWLPVAGAGGYRLSVSLPGGRSWSREATETHLTYPDDEPQLEPGGVNIATLVTLDDVHAADKSFLRVIDAESLAKLNAQEAAIRDLHLDPDLTTYLLAQLHRQEGLSAAAITELAKLVEGNMPVSAAVWQQLGGLYFGIGLLAPAEESYEAALETAVAESDGNGQAAAHVGLAQVAHAFKEMEQAIAHLETAEILYRQAGAVEQADLVAAERAGLEQ